MVQTVSLITSAVFLSLSVTSQGSQYVVTNAYDTAGCGGELTQKAALSTGICINAKQECERNQDLQSACNYLKTMPFGNDISFIPTCRGQEIVANVFKGAGCDQSQFFGSLPIPTDVCLSDFKFACSDDPKYVIPRNSSGKSSSTSGGTSTSPPADNASSNSHNSMQWSIMGILGILGGFFA